MNSWFSIKRNYINEDIEVFCASHEICAGKVLDDFNLLGLS
jgi:hypothetical protein